MMPNKIYDISVDIRKGMVVYPKDPRFRFRQAASVEKDGVSLHKIMMGNHTGTHVDAPAHFIEGGASVTDLALELMNGRVRVIEVHSTEKIDVSELQQSLMPDDFRILFKTKNSLLWSSRKKFKKDYVYMTPGSGQFSCAKRRQAGWRGLPFDRSFRRLIPILFTKFYWEIRSLSLKR